MKKPPILVTGADRIAANGDTANKIGTYSVALLARDHDIPFYVAAPTSTFGMIGPACAVPGNPQVEVTGDTSMLAGSAYTWQVANAEPYMPFVLIVDLTDQEQAKLQMIREAGIDDRR